jgi:hypothetical protein
MRIKLKKKGIKRQYHWQDATAQGYKKQLKRVPCFLITNFKTTKLFLSFLAFCFSLLLLLAATI